MLKTRRWHGGFGVESLLLGCALTGAVAGPRPAWGEEAAEPQLWPALGRGGFGYVDERGAFVIPPRFERARNFADGLACVQVGGKWGYINPEGRFVLPPQFTWAYDFAGGAALAGFGVSGTLKIWRLEQGAYWSVEPIATGQGATDVTRAVTAYGHRFLAMQ